MYANGIAIVAITRRGVETARRIKTTLASLRIPCTVYAPEKYAKVGVVPMDKKLDTFIRDIYSTVDAIVAVMAAGIIIRAVAPHLQGKLADPAVLAVDASGRFVISLLAGHYGGANQLTRLIAEGISATPVITTESDVIGKQSVDELARALHLTIVNPESLVAVNAALVDGKRLALVLVDGVKIPDSAAKCYTVEKATNMEQALKIISNYDAGAVITEEVMSPQEFGKPVTLLKPKTITVGLGARKNVTADQVLEAVNAALKRANVPLERVYRLATVDIKKDSSAMIEASEKLRLTLDFVSVDALRAFKHGDLSPDSKLVEEKIGVGGVCERAALITAGEKPRLILKKMKMNGVTVAVAEGE
ncbi:cobalt-precorrin 5A hydrolase [Candidatus Bathyarchaeota archaeon A05DMB-2]|jgi:cobalt-precorrin 5A hydrolase|nr:cobalt-precorrin 5A hydrolase [Candidatus Bathyarchaeota archaeon A05DMB-2]